MNARPIKRRLAYGAGALGAWYAAKTALAAWCDRRGVAPPLRSPLLPALALPYTDSTLPLWRLMFRVPRWSGPKVSVTTRRFGDANIRVRVTTPVGVARRRPLVVWLHSGGMISGSPQFEGPTAGLLARRLDAVVVAPDYRLAPEHPFPAALDDCLDTVKWAITHADHLGIDPDRIVLAGASAGGGLAATCAQRCQDEGLRIRAVALLYPMLDDRAGPLATCEAVAWSGASNEFAWSAYLNRPSGAESPWPYSAATRREELAGTPPTWIAVGDIDVLCAEAAAYASRLREAGVPCELTVVDGMYHAADLLVPWARSIRALYQDLTTYLHLHLAD